MTPLISFIIATHKRPASLIRTINSVIAQGPDAEIIVVADEGDRETRAAAAGALRETDIFISNPSLRGPSESRNLGCRSAHGQWLCFLDDDDTVAPDYLEQAKPHLASGRVIFGNFMVAQDEADLSFAEHKRKPLGNKPIASIEVTNFIPVGAFFVPTDLAQQVAFDKYLPSHEDWDYLLQLYALAPFHHADIWGFRYHRASGPHRNTMKREERRLAYLAIYSRHPASNADAKRKRAECLARMGIELKPRFL